MIRVFQPALGEEELAAVNAVFEAQWPGTGERVRQFEEAFAAFLGVTPEQMVAVTSCTEGLFQAVAALELKPGCEVVLPTVSFIGAAHAVRAAGACVRLVDVDPATLNPNPNHLAEVLTHRTRALLVLHYGGRLPEIQAIAELARASSITLIEDSACALGGTIGSAAYGTFGDIGVWSFDAMKLLVTGDGGMLRIANPTLKQKILERVSLGGVRPGHSAPHSGAGWWEVSPSRVGRKARMNDLAAAIGLVQLNRVPAFIERRRHIARLYDTALRDLPWIRLPPPSTSGSIPYFYWIQMKKETRDKLAIHLREHGAYTTFRYWPLHRTDLYSDGRSYPGADLAADTTLLLPVHQGLTDDDVNRIIELVCCF